MLSRRAREFAAEISSHDWSDAPYRLDRAGHDRRTDSRASDEVLSPEETDRVRTNVAWVVAQVLKHEDPNLDLYEFAAACGVPRSITHRSNGSPSGAIPNGLRWEDKDATAAAAPGAPLWKATLQVEVQNLVLFRRLLRQHFAAGDGTGVSEIFTASTFSSTGCQREVILLVRAWDDEAAAQLAVAAVEASRPAADAENPVELKDLDLARPYDRVFS